jgi:fucose permease
MEVMKRILSIQKGRNSRFRDNAPVWIGVAISFYSFIAIGIAEGGLGVLLPSILATYQLTPATVTLLFISQVTGYIFAAFTSSLINSRLGLAKTLFIASIALTSTLLVYALSPYWTVMVLVGAIFGVGIGLIDASINTYIVSDQRNANLIGQLHAFYGIGALLGPTIATMLLSLGLNWRQVYLVIASIVGLLVLGVVWVLISRYQPMTKQVVSTNTSPVESLQLAVKNPIVLVSGLLLLIYVGTEASVGSWAYTVQHVGRNIPAVHAGYSISAYWLGLTIGRLGLGWFVKRFGAVRMITLSLALLIVGLLAWWRLPGQWLSLPLIGFAFAAIFPTTIWLMPQRVSQAVIPAAIGFMTSVGSLGAAIIPTVMGWIANQIGLESIPVMSLLCAIVMVFLHRWLTRHTASPNQLSEQTNEGV